MLYKLLLIHYIIVIEYLEEALLEYDFVLDFVLSIRGLNP